MIVGWNLFHRFQKATCILVDQDPPYIMIREICAIAKPPLSPLSGGSFDTDFDSDFDFEVFKTLLKICANLRLSSEAGG
jgi:hypothetical protein